MASRHTALVPSYKRNQGQPRKTFGRTRPVYCIAATPNSNDVLATIFGIPELFEHIFSYLGLKDLLLTQRTSKQIKFMINTSRKLRRTLHLEPPARLQMSTPASGYTILPLLPPIFTPGGLPHVMPAGLYASKLTTKTKQYPAQLQARLLLRQGTPRYGSWRAMFVTQPPLRSVDVKLIRIARRLQDCERSVTRTLSGNPGVRLGQMVDEAWRMAADRAPGHYDFALIKAVLGGTGGSSEEVPSV